MFEGDCVVGSGGTVLSEVPWKIPGIREIRGIAWGSICRRNGGFGQGRVGVGRVGGSTFMVSERRLVKSSLSICDGRTDCGRE